MENNSLTFLCAGSFGATGDISYSTGGPRKADAEATTSDQVQQHRRNKGCSETFLSNTSLDTSNPSLNCFSIGVTFFFCYTFGWRGTRGTVSVLIIFIPWLDSRLSRSSLICFHHWLTSGRWVVMWSSPTTRQRGCTCSAGNGWKAWLTHLT